MSASRLTTFLLLFCFGVHAHAGIELNFWNSYVHYPSGQTHYSFHLSSSHRGLFLGPCGFSTRRGLWQYTVDLAGPGPTYSGPVISVQPDFESQPFTIRSGTIFIDSNRNKATIALEITTSGRTTKFIGNGTYHIRAIK